MAPARTPYTGDRHADRHATKRRNRQHSCVSEHTSEEAEWTLRRVCALLPCVFRSGSGGGGGQKDAGKSEGCLHGAGVWDLAVCEQVGARVGRVKLVGLQTKNIYFRLNSVFHFNPQRLHCK